MSTRFENGVRNCEIANHLLIKLGHEVGEFTLGLDIDWVVLNTVGCRHD